MNNYADFYKSFFIYFLFYGYFTNQENLLLKMYSHQDLQLIALLENIF